MLFLVLAQDLNTLSRNNEFGKFADDTTLLVTENSDVSVATVFSYTQDWANENTMIILLKARKSYSVIPEPNRFLFLIPYMALNEYHQLSSLVSIFREISAVICILNTLSLFQVRDFIYLRLGSAKVLA